MINHDRSPFFDFQCKPQCCKANRLSCLEMEKMQTSRRHLMFMMFNLCSTFLKSRSGMMTVFFRGHDDRVMDLPGFSAASASASSSAAASAAGFFFFDFLGIRWIHQTSSTCIHRYRYILKSCCMLVVCYRNYICVNIIPQSSLSTSST